MATTNTSSTATFGSASVVPFGSCTFTATPDAERSSENGTRLMTSLRLQACVLVSAGRPAFLGCQVHTQSPAPAAARQLSGVEESLQSGSLRRRSTRHRILAGSGWPGAPRTALNAFSCTSNDEVRLK